MDQEGHAPANMRRKTKDAIAHNFSVQNADNKKFGKSVCSPVVDLTDDAWLLVFSYLDTADRTRIARVCRRWRELARTSWKAITRLSFTDIFKYPYATEGSSNYHRLTDDILKACLRQCETRLRCLDLCNSLHRLTPRALDLVGRYGTSLQELNFCQIDLDSTALKTVTEGLPRLRFLRLINCKYIGEEELRTSLKMPQSLKSLNVAYNYWINDDILSQAPQSLIEVIATLCGQLTDRGVRFLVERRPNLETIDISLCDDLPTGQSIIALAKNCPRLKRFRFGTWNGQSLLTEGDILTLSNLPLLEELDMGDHSDAVTDQVFYELGRHCPLLRSITCSGCHQLTNAAIDNLSPCRHLETVDLGRCHQITDRGLIQLSSAHSQLKKVDIRECKNIGDEGVCRLLSEHPNLLELHIANCPRVTDRVVPILEQRRRQVQPLKVWPLIGTSVSIEKRDAFR